MVAPAIGLSNTPAFIRAGTSLAKLASALVLIAALTDISTAQPASAATAQGWAYPALKDWLQIGGSLAVVIIAGSFALRQQRRASSAQRDLELEKLNTTRRQAELSEERAASTRFRQAQVLPFLERLHASLTYSFAVVQIPDFFRDLGTQVPQIRLHTDSTVDDWLRSMRQMSEYRIQLLLTLEVERIPAVVKLMTELVEHARSVISVRQKYWYKQAERSELRSTQSDYVRVGYQLLLEVKEAILVPSAHRAMSDAEKQRLASELATPLEKSGTVAVPYGEIQDFSWLSIWQIDIRPDWQKFEQAASHSTLDEFMEAAKSLAKQLYDVEDVIDTKLVVVTESEQTMVICLSAKLPSLRRLRQFQDVDLPSYRRAFRVLWSSHRAPIEITTGTSKDGRQGSQSNAESDTPSGQSSAATGQPCAAAK